MAEVSATCSDYGCLSDYVPENSCQCNEACELYNDCCVDYNTFCVDALCESYGCSPDYKPSNPCQCNDACEFYNDCCSDYVSFCINGELSDGSNQYSDYAQNSITYSSILMAVMFTLMINTIIQFILMIRNKAHQTLTKQAITTQSDDRIVTFGTFLSILFYFVCILCYLIASIALTETYNELEEGTTSNVDLVDMKINAETASIVFWNFGYGVMQIVLSARLYFTFNKTEYAYPKWVYLTLALIWFCELAAMIMFHVEREGFDNYVLTSLLVIGLVTHILFLGIVMSLYTRNLFKVTLSRNELLLHEKENEVEKKRMKELVDHTTRMSVLTLFAGIFTLCSLVIWLIFFKEEDEAQGGEGVTFEFLNTAWWLLPMDALINALCLFLNLPFLFAFDVYRKVCCGCHRVCGSICMMMVNSMDEKRETEMGKVETEQDAKENQDDNETAL